MQAALQAFCCRCSAAERQSRPQPASPISNGMYSFVPRLAIKRPQKLMYVIGSAISCTPLLSPVAWLVLSIPTADKSGETQREPSYLAAVGYVSLCPQQAWLNVRLLLEGDGAGVVASWLAGMLLFQLCWRAHMSTSAPASTAVREDDGASNCLDDWPALLVWDQKYTLRQSSLRQLQEVAKDTGLHGRSRMRKPELLQALEELHAHERIESMHRSLQVPPRRGRAGKARKAI